MEHRGALRLLFPKKCLLCRRVLWRDEGDLCGKCRAETEEFPYTFLNSGRFGKKKLQFLDSFTAVWYYEGKVRDSLRRFKFYGAGSYAAAYGRILAQKLRSTGDAPRLDGVTWVPISPRRKKKRGYDQGELLAAALARELGLPAVQTLKKVWDNPPQSGQDAAHRRANVLGVFAPTGAPVPGKSWLLADDIVTTGATVQECARVLKTAGAAEVHVVCVAMTRKDSRKNSKSDISR